MSKHFPLDSNQVDVWRIPLVGSGSTSSLDFGPLSGDEILRARRFHFEHDRVRFIAARAALRNILASYLSISAQEVTFSYLPKGKPELAPPFQTSAIQFNLSHSRDFALLAVTRDSHVGVDIEFIDPEHATGDIASRFFSPAEIRTLQTLPEPQRDHAFFQCWTRKEAYMKALGDGLSLPLASFDVAFGPGVQPALLRSERSPRETSRWSLYDIPAPSGYAAAVIVEGQDHRFQWLDWPV